MNRKLLIVMMLTAVLAGEGCRRSGGGKKDPILVPSEKDYLYSGNLKGSSDPVSMEEMGNRLKPPKKLEVDPNKLDHAKTTKKGIPLVKYPPEFYDYNVQVMWPIVQGEAFQKAQQKLQKDIEDSKKTEEDEQRLDDTEELRKLFLIFRGQRDSGDAGPRGDESQTRGRFLSYLRRKEKYSIYEQMAAGAMEVTFFYSDANANDIVCRHKTPQGKQGFPVFQYGQFPDPPNFKQPPVLMAQEVYDGALRLQELKFVWNRVWEYARPQYMADKDSAAPQDRLEYLRIISFPPPASIEAVGRAFQGKYAKNPPGSRSYADFISYLKENQPNEIWKAIEAGKIRVNPDADFRDANAVIVAHGTPDSKTKLHVMMNANGLAFPGDGAAFQRNFPDRKK